MHRISFLVFGLFLCGLTAVAQQNPSPKSAPSSANAKDLTKTGVAPNDVVISVNGVCDDSLLVEGSTVGGTNSTPGSDASGSGTPPASADQPVCKTEVTRAQFETLVAALAPNMKRSDRIRVAVRYAEGLVLSEQGKKVGIDKDPAFLEKMRYGYVQTLSASYTDYLTQKAFALNNSEVEQYYKEHPELFVEAHFLRIFIPNERKHSTSPTTPEGVEQRNAADEAAMKSLGERIHKRAVAGESFTRLEAEVYKAAGESPDDTPDVDLGENNRAEAPPELQSVFDLKPGQISDLLPAPKGWHIIKMVSRRTVPLAEAKPLLVRIKIAEFTNAAKSTAKTDFNDAYFNTEGGMDAPGATSEDSK
jgi:hypothetical protein